MKRLTMLIVAVFVVVPLLSGPIGSPGQVSSDDDTSSVNDVGGFLDSTKYIFVRFGDRGTVYWEIGTGMEFVITINGLTYRTKEYYFDAKGDLITDPFVVPPIKADWLNNK